jgi:tRNA-2-methylthio-N6-dimethylallyladenosine synthase
VKEINLLGQNVNSYRGVGSGGKTWNLPRLLYAIAEIGGLKRLRYTTSNPKDFTIDMARAHRDIDILMPFLHFPVQSGSDDVLRRMNRKYSVDDYLKCLDILRDHKPDMAFSSDFIVGFPGETADDFQKTIDLATKVRFAQAYSFKYSPRPHTAALKMDNQIPENIKSERLEILQQLLNDHQMEFNKSFVGNDVNVLFVKDGKHKNQLIGRSEYSQAVSVCDSNIIVGDICVVNIVEVGSHSLIGVIAR